MTPILFFFSIPLCALYQVQPTIRKDCNYSSLDGVKKEAVWDDEYQRWKVPDLAIVKTKLPPAGEYDTLFYYSKYRTFYNCHINQLYALFYILYLRS